MNETTMEVVDGVTITKTQHWGPRTIKTLQDILVWVCKKYGVSEKVMRSRKRPKAAVAARGEYAWLAHHAGHSYPAMAAFLSLPRHKFNHTTFLLAARRHEAAMESKP